MARLFIALDLSIEDKQKISLLDYTIAQEHVRKIPQQNYHLTLAFLGQLTSEQQILLMKTLDDQHHQLPHQAITLTTDNFGLFRKPQVAYVAIKKPHCALESLEQHIANLCSVVGYKAQHQEFVPHISILRKAKSQPTPQPSTHNLNLTCTSYSLYESVSAESGVKYLPLKTWQLID